MNRTEFSTVFLPMCATFKREADPLLVEAWYELVKGYSGQGFAKAVKNYLSEDESGFFPMPAKVIKRMQKIDMKLLDPEEAWAAAKSIVNGNWDSNPWKGIDCPIMKRACQAIGYCGFDNSEQLSFSKMRFIETYEAMSKPETVERFRALEDGTTPKELANVTGGLFTDVSGILDEMPWEGKK